MGTRLHHRRHPKTEQAVLQKPSNKPGEKTYRGSMALRRIQVLFTLKQHRYTHSCMQELATNLRGKSLNIYSTQHTLCNRLTYIYICMYTHIVHQRMLSHSELLAIACAKYKYLTKKLMHETLTLSSSSHEESGIWHMTLLSRNGKLANEVLCSCKAAGPEEEHILPTVRLLFREA